MIVLKKGRNFVFYVRVLLKHLMREGMSKRLMRQGLRKRITSGVWLYEKVSFRFALFQCFLSFPTKHLQEEETPEEGKRKTRFSLKPDPNMMDLDRPQEAKHSDRPYNIKHLGSTKDIKHLREDPTRPTEGTELVVKLCHPTGRVLHGARTVPAAVLGLLLCEARQKKFLCAVCWSGSTWGF